MGRLAPDNNECRGYSSTASFVRGQQPFGIVRMGLPSRLCSLRLWRRSQEGEVYTGVNFLKPHVFFCGPLLLHFRAARPCRKRVPCLPNQCCTPSALRWQADEHPAKLETSA